MVSPRLLAAGAAAACCAVPLPTKSPHGKRSAGRARPTPWPLSLLNGMQLAFMPPESFGEGPEKLTPKLDVYSMGICGELHWSGKRHSLPTSAM